MTFGPNVTIETGEHRSDVIGEYMSLVVDKILSNDQDVRIEDDVWIGAGVIILKGSSQKCYRRFGDTEIKEHERLLVLKDIEV